MTTRFDSAPDLLHCTHAVRSEGVSLHVETLELSDLTSASRTVLLLSEAEAPSSRWPEDLLVGLARIAGRCVWFDTRDVGASSWCDEPYAMADLVADARTVIDVLGLMQVDVFGRSMGGEIALRLALSSPEHIRSLVLLSTTPGRREELGLPEDWLVEKMSDRLLGPAPTEAHGQTQWMVDQWEWFNGPVFDFDREGAVAVARGEIASGWRGPNGHGVAVMEADDIVEDLRSLTTPTTIIHGTADPVLPLDHARALNVLINGSRLTLVEGLGHELPTAFVDQLLGYVEGHLS